jgi:hypothetical protein
LWIKLKLSKESKLGAILVLHSQWSARKFELQKRPAGHTAGLFFIPRNPDTSKIAT